MPRIRTIKPELLEDEKVAALSHLEWRLFVSCLLLADDYGNFRAAPARIHGSALWAHPREDLAKALEALATTTLVIFYVVEGQSYAHIAGWEKHQKVDHPGKPLCPALTAVSRDTRETLAKIPETLAPDRDRDRDQDREREPARPPAIPGATEQRTGPRSKIWSAHDWFTTYAIAWRDRYSTWPGGDSKSSGRLGDVLEDLTEVERAAAQTRAPEMLREFLANTDQRVVDRRHSWSFFVTEWSGLRVPKVAIADARSLPTVLDMRR